MNSVHTQVKITTIFLLYLTTANAIHENHCPEVKPMRNFNIFAMLGKWFVVQHYSSTEEALTYNCMRVEFILSRGNMDMIMKLTYRYAADPNQEAQTGNMTWQIPDPQRPEKWRHIEDHYKGVYNTDVIDTDYNNWLILLHCSDPEPEKNFLSSFILSRSPRLDRLTTLYLREKVGQYDIQLEYLFPVNQTNCFGEVDPVYEEEETNERSQDQGLTISQTTEPFEDDGELLYD